MTANASVLDHSGITRHKTALHSERTFNHDRIARQIDLALVCQRLKLSNFFMHAPHVGRLRFHLGHEQELKSLPREFRHARLLLHYSVDVQRHRDSYRQIVTLEGPSLQQTLEARGEKRPHSKIGGYAWCWICPACEEPTNLLLARIGQPFACIDCHGRAAKYILPATFTALPPEVR